jgi:hypothetical protein
MFIGHWAPAIAAAAASPKSPKLGTLFVAAQLTDFAFFIFAIVGIEKMRITPGITAMNGMDLFHMPYTHSLLGSALWGLAFAILIYAVTKDRLASAIAGLVVLSHWFIDLLVHTKDLTLWGAPPKMGLGLWNYPAIEMPLELGITALALYWYWRRTRGPIGPILIMSLLLLLFQLADWFGPPPVEAGPSLYIMVLASYTVAALVAWWVGRTRTHKQPQG